MVIKRYGQKNGIYISFEDALKYAERSEIRLLLLVDKHWFLTSQKYTNKLAYTLNFDTTNMSIEEMVEIENVVIPYVCSLGGDYLEIVRRDYSRDEERLGAQ